ncbi:MAG: hypothetical protein Q9181_004479 [Wetmoreana brouardii]
MSYSASTGGQPPSFKTNVNRAKTKRWVEAKSYSYDGDDWGDMDEYDEYGGYDEPAPPPRPTGFRQRGQSASREPQGIYQSQQPGYGIPEANQHGYPNMGRQTQVQQQYGPRSVTNPPYQPSQLPRPGSFDQGDERRAFSATHPQQTVPLQGAYDYSTGPPISQNHQNQPGPSGLQHGFPTGAHDPYLDEERTHATAMNNRPPASEQLGHTSTGSRTQSMTSNTPSIDFHNRRDFSPSAVPPPLHTRGSPSPHNRSDTQSAWLPPRKSSLSQQNQPETPYSDFDPRILDRQDPEDTGPPPRERADSDISKPLPLVRPVDIYRRRQEEKERQRQSQESPRPSMDVIMSEGPSEGAAKRDPSRESERSQAAEAGRKPKSALDPVAERKSEYGMSGIPLSETDFRGGSVEHRTLGTESTKPAESKKITQSLSPQLPNVVRMSGFGELFGGTPQKTEDTSGSLVPEETRSLHTNSHQPPPGQLDATLQHQPSLGLRSVVHQAFDTPPYQIPETPSSSTADSSIGRSGSGGTSVVSPIISRGPSSATANLQLADPHIRSTAPPAAKYEEGSEGRPTSSGSLGTPKAVTRKLSPDQANQRPASFIPGHRRDLSTPSPDNSPARTPAVEANKQMQQPQEAEIAMTTPIEPHFPRSYGEPENALSTQASPAKTTSAGVTDIPTPRVARGAFIKTGSAGSLKSLQGETPKSPAESTRSRVRNLADKFESGRSSPAGSERAPSPVKTSFASSQVYQQPRPLAADRMESFRPKLPGGWESSVSLAPLETPIKSEITPAAVPLQQRLQNLETDRSIPSAGALRTANDRVETPRQESLKPSPTKDETSPNDPFTSLTAAGNALAGAFSSVMGSDNDEKEGARSAAGSLEAGRQQEQTTAQKGSPATRPRATSGNTVFMPEASKPTMLATPDDGTSSIMPTPLDKISRPSQQGEGKATDYFAGGAVPKQQWSGDSYTTEKSTSTERSQLTPSLSIDTGLQYESDRLRREIIRELSPRLTSEPGTAKSDSPLRNQAMTQADPRSSRHPHESMVLPQEYDSYWNGSGSERSSKAPSAKASLIAATDASGPHVGNEGTTSSTPGMIEPPVLGTVAQPTQSNAYERPSMPQRFSWEGPTEVISQRLEPVEDPMEQSLSDTKGREGVPDKPKDQVQTSSDTPVSQQGLRPLSLVPQPVDPGFARNAVANDRMKPQGERMSSEEDRVLNRGRTEQSPASEQPVHSGLVDILRDLPPSAINDGPRIDQGQQDINVRAEIPPQPAGMADSLPPLPTQPIVPPKIPSFREILAMKESKDRIRAYNESRDHFARIDTGLAHWLAVTSAELPEHKDVFPDGRLPGIAGYRPSPTRSKLGGLLSSGNPSGQQAYHQQHPNANSPSGVSESAQAQRGNPTQGYSPSTSTGKLSSQQMQARGKDLLHSAGVFGGKANIAAKGLISKGKSKFRGGNADKAPVSSFNTTYNRDGQLHKQSTESAPSTPNSGSIPERPHSSKQTSSSRPFSYMAPPEHRSSAILSQERQQDQQLSPPPVEVFPSHGRYVAETSGNSGQKPWPVGAPFPSSEFPKQGPQQMISPPEAVPVPASEHVTLRQDPISQGTLPIDHANGIQGPHPSIGDSRNPTQADYAEYFRRGSSPTVQVPQAKAAETSHDASTKEAPLQQSLPRDYTSEPHAPLALRSKYSTQTSRELLAANGSGINKEQGQSLTGQDTSNRESEDSGGTFHTATSDVHRDPGRPAAGSQQSMSSTDQVQPADVSDTESSNNDSPKTATPIAVPAANIQDQSRARPFSFIQFPQNASPKPLEDYSRRKPSIESTPSEIDPEQDVPPSPMSCRQSAIDVRRDQPARTDPGHGSADQGFASGDMRRISGSPSRSFSRPFQDSSLQNHPSFRPEHPPTAKDDLPVQHYPAPVPRQEPVNPRQQSTEYSLEGVGPPPVPRTTNATSTSKRGSRSSAFFKSFKSPTESTSPALSGEKNGQDDVDRQGEPTMRKTKSKRGSLFRSLTKGSKASSSEDTVQKSQDSPRPANVQKTLEPSADIEERNDIPPKTTSKYRNRLSRNAAPKDIEAKPEPVKKRRLTRPASRSLFGISKNQARASFQPELPPQILEQAQPQGPGGPQGRRCRLSSSTKPDRGHAPPPKNIAGQEHQYQYTRDSLAKEGLLPQGSRQSSSKTSERSAYEQDQAQRQQSFSPRHQSLGYGGHQLEQRRPSEWTQQQPSSSSNIRPQPAQALGPQAAKDSNDQPRPHHRVSIDTSPVPGFRKATEPPLQTMNYWKPPSFQPGNIATPSQTEHHSTQSPLPSQPQTRQSLPPLQTSMPNPSNDIPSQPRVTDNKATSDLEARKLKRSQVESLETPKAEQAVPAISLFRRSEDGNAGRKVEGSGEGDRERARKSDDDDEPVVMSATSFPGQEWQPVGYNGGWEEY